MLPWQDKFLRDNVGSFDYGHVHKELYIPRESGKLFHILATWPGLDMLGYDFEIDRAIRYGRCHCGRTMERHDCYCYECAEVMTMTVTKHPEFGYADEIYTCPRCGSRGANRSFIQFPK